MMIQTYDSDYIVIKHIQSSSIKDVYICRKNQEKGNNEYTIVCIKDVGVSETLLTFFSREVDTKKFTDFVQSFTFEGKLNFVFHHTNGLTLEEKLERQSCLFQERLQMARKILERIIYLDMPFSFQADALMMHHIIVSDTLDIHFDYEMNFLSRLSDYTIQEIGLDIDNVFGELFAPELQKMNCPEIIEFLEWLHEGEYQSYLDIFYKFNACYEILSKKTEKDLIEPQTRPFKIWDQIKKIFDKVKFALMAALLVGACSYLLISVIKLVLPNSRANVEAVDHYDYIGTLKIQDSQEERDSAPSDDTAIQRSRME